jgi:hypothetical protein
MSEFWSFQVDAPDEVLYPELLLAIGPGPDAFNLAIDDPKAFCDDLVTKGVRVLYAARLDAFEEASSEPPLLEAARENIETDGRNVSQIDPGLLRGPPESSCLDRADCRRDGTVVRGGRRLSERPRERRGYSRGLGPREATARNRIRLRSSRSGSVARCTGRDAHPTPFPSRR